MITKVYEKILDFIKKEYKFFLVLIVVTILFTIKLPYYIDMPGGTINISDRLEIDSSKKLEGTLNYAYVSEMRATLPTYLLSYIKKDWDLVKKEEVNIENEKESETNFRDVISLKEAMSNALYAAFKEANETFEIENRKIYATYIFNEAKTDVKIGDQIIKINDKKIETIEDLKIVNSYKEGDTAKITVINKGKEYERTATLINYEGKIIIGVSIQQTYDIKSDRKINIKYKSHESGPSGGMMTSLTAYSYLKNIDITKGRKIVGTGTIDENGNIGEIGGVKYKLIGAVNKKADIFLVPNGDNYEEAKKIKEEKKYDIKIIGVSTLSEAINELEKN